MVDKIRFVVFQKCWRSWYDLNGFILRWSYEKNHNSSSEDNNAESFSFLGEQWFALCAFNHAHFSIYGNRFCTSPYLPPKNRQSKSCGYPSSRPCRKPSIARERLADCKHRPLKKNLFPFVFFFFGWRCSQHWEEKLFVEFYRLSWHKVSQLIAQAHLWRSSSLAL